ncbi:uncharacterized protein G2W53_026881 [Senna tora]|uniref:Uncharacterized protein n=1 Tax=Senna tora TaxID=362788 RepID=A0A834TI61_9FABA|nr:uncharacterized protein G2W53_026881 [Senna tora]
MEAIKKQIRGPEDGKRPLSQKAVAAEIQKKEMRENWGKASMNCEREETEQSVK